jgi:geranylgeranyl transferase type-1 subunit beta
MSIGFFLLNSLDILNHLETFTTEDERQHWIDWIYLCQHPTGGFRGSPATKTSGDSIYDAPHLPAAYFAIASLLILGDDLKRVNRGGLLTSLRKSQNEDGSFAPVLLEEEKFGEVDVRHVYCAIAVREMLLPIKNEEDINIPAVVSYIRQCKVFPLPGFLMIVL